MSVVLLILKILGVLFLILLGLVLFLVLLVLFCPFSYRVWGTYQKEKPCLRGKLSWLFGLLSVCAQYKGEIRFFLRICGRKKNFRGKSDNSHDFADTKEQTAPEHPSQDGDAEEVCAPESGESVMQAQEVRQEPKQKMGILSRIRGFFSTIKNTASSIGKMIRQWKKTFRKIMDIWEQESTKEAVRFLGKQIFGLFGKLKPGKCKLKLRFSTGSPDTTGQLLGVFAMFPLGYRNRWEITPDFVSETAYADADTDIRGRLFGFQLLGMLVRIVLDKNCRNLYNKLIR